MQRYVYDPRSGELLLSGADSDGKLTPGTQDVLSSSQTRYEKAPNVAEFPKNSDRETQAGEWYLVTRNWNYPTERKGERRLVSESRSCGTPRAFEVPLAASPESNGMGASHGSRLRSRAGGSVGGR